MRVVAFDTETALIRPGMPAPELACLTYQEQDHEPHILHWTEAYDFVRRQLLDRSVRFVGHNVAYDFGVLGAAFPDLVPLIFEAYEQDRVTDTMLRQQLLDIAAGCYRGKMGDGNQWIKYDYSLLSVTRRLTGRVLDKDQWRLGYGALRDVPLAEWPEGARLYPLEDARATLDCFLAQQKHIQFLESQYHEARAAFWLHLCSAWGLRTRADAVDKLRAFTEQRRNDILGELVAAKLVRVDGSRNTKVAKALMEAACNAAGKPVPRTKTQQVALDSDSCEYSEDPTLETYAEYATLGKVLKNDIPALASGTVLPVHTHFGLAESGRTTSASPNVQNWRRLEGIRECFVPRPGYVFIDCDYGALELWALGQAVIDLFGRSKLAEVLNSGADPHTLLAADILGIPPDVAKERKKDPTDKEFFLARQTAKVGNFGLPCGMGAKTFVHFAKKSYDTILTFEQASSLKAAWMNLWRDDMEPYFEHISNLVNNPDGLGTIELPRTHMVRSGARFTAAANTYYQGLGAAAAKCAGWLIAKACYVDRSSPLFGSRPVNFVHDQWLVETPEGPGMHDAAMELVRLMREGARQMMPDCVPGVEPVLARCWSKDAKPVYENGRLIPWETTA